MYKHEHQIIKITHLNKYFVRIVNILDLTWGFTGVNCYYGVVHYLLTISSKYLTMLTLKMPTLNSCRVSA